MKKTTASLLLLIGIASTPAFAETNPADPYEGYNRDRLQIQRQGRPNTSFPLSHAAIAK